MFEPDFNPATVVPLPGTMKASGKTTINGVKICVVGDEGKVSVPGCTYMTKIHLKPGTGTLKIDVLAGDQQSKKTKSGGKVIILKGSEFTAKFEVQSPAEDISKVPAGGPPVPDTTLQYAGKGKIVPANTLFKVT